MHPAAALQAAVQAQAQFWRRMQTCLLEKSPQPGTLAQTSVHPNVDSMAARCWQNTHLSIL